MHGEFLGVWSETWREIWEPLTNQEGVPSDIFCELYRELSRALKPLNVEQARECVLNDSIQRREAFDEALAKANSVPDILQRDVAYGRASTEHRDADERKQAMIQELAPLVGSADEANRFLDQAIDVLANDASKREEARARLLEATINSTTDSRQRFQETSAGDFVGERAIVYFLEEVHVIFGELDDGRLIAFYYDSLDAFIAKFNLRYDLRSPCVLCPTLQGVFGGLLREIRAATTRDRHLQALMADFENSLRDLRIDCGESRIKTCMQKQINLMEALGRNSPGVSTRTLGAICDEVGSWPHEKVKQAMKDIYAFACDYPGIRHSGTPAAAMRAIGMRDLVAVSVLLAGFTPYLAHQLDGDTIYYGV